MPKWSSLSEYNLLKRLIFQLFLFLIKKNFKERTLFSKSYAFFLNRSFIVHHVPLLAISVKKTAPSIRLYNLFDVFHVLDSTFGRAPTTKFRNANLETFQAISFLEVNYMLNFLLNIVFVPDFRTFLVTSIFGAELVN